jgi:cell division protein ZapA
MAQVDIQIGGRQYELACRDGEEEHLRSIARMLDRKAADVSQSMGGLNEARHLLLAALLLADELNDVRTAPTGNRLGTPAPDPALASAVERLAERMESLAERLEAEGSNA